MINYNYLGKYIVDVTLRREGSSRFAPGHRYGTFWAVGAAWNISQEEFMSQVKFINLLKLRASYGLSGNANVLNSDGTADYYPYQPLLGFGLDYADQGGSYPAQYPNPNLTWEKNKTLDLGIDFVVWDNRINGTIAYYNKNTYDLLQAVPLSRTTGHSDIKQNVGAVVNKGIEAMINVDVVRAAKMHWSVNFNIATVKNEVTKLAQNAAGTDINIQNSFKKVEVGHPIYAWYMRKYAGVDTGLCQFR
jgi:outer membrane receptor protein involved in Fe transport